MSNNNNIIWNFEELEVPLFWVQLVIHVVVFFSRFSFNIYEYLSK